MKKFFDFQSSFLKYLKLIVLSSYRLVSNFGFTLIEFVVTIGIISLLTGLTIAGYARLNQRQALLAGGKSLESTILDAQSRSYNSEIDCSVCSCLLNEQSNFSGWYVDFVNRQIYGQCGEDKFFVKNFELSPEIIITPHITPPTTILFKSSPTRNTTIDPPRKSTICVSHANLTDIFYVIRISEVGTVTSDGGLVTTCTP